MLMGNWSVGQVAFSSMRLHWPRQEQHSAAFDSVHQFAAQQRVCAFIFPTPNYCDITTMTPSMRNLLSFIVVLHLTSGLVILPGSFIHSFIRSNEKLFSLRQLFFSVCVCMCVLDNSQKGLQPKHDLVVYYKAFKLIPRFSHFRHPFLPRFFPIGFRVI